MELGLQAQILIALGFLFILAETIVPAFGMLAIVGAIAFVWGGLIVHHHPEIHTMFLNPASVWGIGIFAVLLTIAIGLVVKRAYSKPTTTGQESMIGDTGTVISWTEKSGSVQINGEIWKAKSKTKLNLKEKDKVQITETDELILIVKKGD